MPGSFVAAVSSSWPDMLVWLQTPLSGRMDHALASSLAWHGRLMTLAWAVLVPLGVLVARYLKVTRRQDWPRTLDNPLWWHGHRAAQYSAVALSTLGVWLAWQSTGVTDSIQPSWVWMHHRIGWSLFILAWLQILIALARGSKGGPTGAGADPADPRTWRGDHYDMSPRRRVFEWLHKLGGHGALLLSVLVVLSGLIAADAPRWMPALIGFWWCLLAAIAVVWQWQNRAIDTYQAIWGPDPRHPGAARRPIGFGIRRYPP